MDTTISADTVESYVELAKGIDHTQAIYALLVLAVGIVLVRMVLLRLFDRFLKKSPVGQQQSTSILRTLVRFLMDFVVVMLAANVAGIPLTSFVAVFSVIGVALSLALQGVLSNLAGGLLIMTTNPFEVGHYIESDGISGTVKDISPMHTRLAAPDGRVIFVPNSTMVSARLINYSMHPTRRMELSVSASYDNSPEEVRGAVLDALKRVPDVKQEPQPIIHVENYGDSAISYSIYAWCDASVFWNTKYAVNEALYAAFAEHGVVMTYPHLNVHLANEKQA